MTQSSKQFLEGLEQSANEVVRRTRELVGGLTPEELLRRPAPDRWSIADCYEHLIRSSEVYHPLIRRAVEEASAAPPDQPFRKTWPARFFISMADDRVRVKAKAPRAFVPPAQARPDAPERFYQIQQEYLEILRAAAGKDLSSARVPSPATRLLKLSLGAALELLVRHQQRHVKQAEALRVD
ncbi:MAG TPA: DinB family protein [Acidobacteriota bacterium]|nr:DinB family protein [Acidobacteriota bacterium]